MRVAQWAEADWARRSGGLLYQSATGEEAWQPTASQASAPPGKQMKHIWTAVLRKFVGPFPACHPQGTSPTSSPASHLLLSYFSQEAIGNPKLNFFFLPATAPPPRISSTPCKARPHHIQHSCLIFMGLCDQKNRNSNKNPAAVWS